MAFNQLQQEIRSNFSEDTKIQIDRVKKKLAKIVAKKTEGVMVRSKAKWYEFGEKNSIFTTLKKKVKNAIVSLFSSEKLNNKQVQWLFFSLWEFQLGTGHYLLGGRATKFGGRTSIFRALL